MAPNSYAYGYYDPVGDEEFTPTSFNNNSIFDCDNALYYETSLHDFDSIVDVNTLKFANNNISEDISASLDSEFRFTGTLSEVDFDTGGLDGSSQEPVWGFSDDMDDVTRTGSESTGWSIGAYEYGE